MLTIGKLRLSLPPGFEPRAEQIARLVARELALLPLQGDAHLDRVTLPEIAVARGASDRQVASAVADAMAAHLNRSPERR